MRDEAANERRDNQLILERLTTQAETNRLVGREWSLFNSYNKSGDLLAN